jgi:hypothetical protein
MIFMNRELEQLDHKLLSPKSHHTVTDPCNEHIGRATLVGSMDKMTSKKIKPLMEIEDVKKLLRKVRHSAALH